ncbi:MAG: phosphomannomutase/phosphoglucomutase [Armatimonadota bacterium]
MTDRLHFIIAEIIWQAECTRSLLFRHESEWKESKINDIILVLNMGIYKACDIRGIYGDDLTDQIAYRIGRAIGTLNPGKTMLVGGDVRISTPALKTAITNGLTDSGVSVVDIGIVPTPVFYFARHHLHIDAGVMVTASHNPPEFNGFKLALGPLPITEDEITDIRRIVDNGDFADGSGSLSRIDIVSEYSSYIKSIAPIPDDPGAFKVIVDCGNGCFSSIAPQIFSSLGYDIDSLFCVPDGSFPNRSPNSSVAGNLRVLSERVISSGADLGIAFDGDGDRVSFVDSRGRMLSADKCIVIMSRWLLDGIDGGKVVYDLKCSSVVPEAVAASGGVPVAERSGHTFIKTSMIREDAVFGGEISGHYFYKSLHGGDDGLYSALMMAYLLSNKSVKLSDLADSIPEYSITPDIRIPYDGSRRELIDTIASNFPDDMISRIDGVKVDFGTGWGLARASVTEPVITLRFESVDPDGLRKIIREFLTPVPELYDRVIQSAFSM